MSGAAYVKEFWSTQIMVDQFTPQDLDGHEHLMAERVTSAIRALGADTERARTRVEAISLRPGFRETFTYGESDWVAWMPLDSSGEGLTPDSGLLMLHDPRGAATMVPLPGLPWGRPLTFSLTPGRGIIYPAWVGYSILPLSGSHSIKAAKVEVASV